ncbi:MAG: CbtA family protein, partial [Actinomycetota bacterium]|nr:CbtA family protein [Actinomycetota bacterium]
LVMPGVNEVPAAFPAVVLWRFRLASFGTELVLWTTIGLAFAALIEPKTAGRQATPGAPVPAD